jgi:peptidoglycan/LPS O-acetylase OafA/YrhL
MKSTSLKISETSSINMHILRIIAVQTINICHALGFYFDLQLAIELGKTTLITFFIISGFLTIFSLNNKIYREDYDFKKYLINRFSRIYPTLVVSLILIIFIDGYWATFNELDQSIYSYNIICFIGSLLLINESAIGLPTFGSANALWPVPMFWWSYFFLGWLILGKKTTKKKYIYYLLLAFFTFMVIFIYVGPLYKENLIYNVRMLFVWVSGVFIFLFLNKYIREKNISHKNYSNQDGVVILMGGKDINFIDHIFSNSKIYGGLSIATFIIALFNQSLTLESYNLIHMILITLSVFFLLIHSQNTNFKFNRKFKKVVRYLSSYSLTMIIMHFPILHFFMPFRDTINNFFLFIIGTLLANVVSLAIASFTERKANKIENYLFKKFKLN